MTLSITLSKKLFFLFLLAISGLIGVRYVLAGHDPNIVHICINNNSGEMKRANTPSDCRNNQTAASMATEAALVALTADLEARLDQLQADLDAEIAARTAADATLNGLVVIAQTTADNAQAMADTNQEDINTLENLLQHFSRTGNDIFLTGANLHVVNGTGTTDGPPNGLGNITIGYNELRTFPGAKNDRSGSHMLVAGSENNYSSFGGIVVGLTNETYGEYASISGGSANIANSIAASVSGGRGNTANGPHSSVSGGGANTASGFYASVSGGGGNIADSDNASISGGINNIASEFYASVSGGGYNTASSYAASISGGFNNTASGVYASVSGGHDNNASGNYGSVSGGNNRLAPGDFNWAAGTLFESQ